MAQYIPDQKNADYSQAHLKETIELFLTCHDLVQADFNSESDPFVVIYMKNKKTGRFEELGRTETITDNPFPSFATSFKIDYYFEEEQILRFAVYDEDKPGSKKLKNHDFIGSATMILGEIVHEKGQIMSKKLLNKKKAPIKNKESKKYSSITIIAEKVSGKGNEIITLQLCMKGLPKMDGMFGKADPYFTLSRSREDGQSVVVYKSIVIKKTLNPSFKSFQIESQKLCNCDPFRPIILTVYDWDKSSNDDLIGSVQTNLNELRSKPQGLTITRHKKKNKTYGQISVTGFSSKSLASFLDYMQGGAEISLCVAIDFTGSNGHPRDAQSLHNIYSEQPSQYQNAVRQIGNIVSVYDFDKKFPVWGFGAHMNGRVHHDFALNWNDHNPEVQGIFGIEEIYLNGIRSDKFQLSGPTLFEPILKKAKALAQIAHNNEGLNYLILLILSDVIINDMRQTKNEIVEMSNANLPISIIIIGLGNADFRAMKELDGDEQGLMDSNGQYAKRDIVQFVQMNVYNDLNSLSKETLMEIPKQLLSYTAVHDIKAGEKAKVDMNVHENLFAMNDEEMKQEQEQELEVLESDYNEAQDMYSNAPLPSGWEKGYDETSGRPYYVNNISQTTQWEHPSAAQ